MMKQLAKETLIYWMSDFILRFLNFMLLPFIALALTVDDFGTYALLTTASILICKLSGFGLGEYLQRYYINTETSDLQKKELISSSFFFTTGISFIVVLLLYSSATFFKESLLIHNQIDMKMVAVVLLGSLPMQLFNFCQNMNRLDFSPWSFSLLNGINTSLTIVLTLIFLFHFNWGILGLLLATSISYLLMAPAALYQIKQHLVFKIDWSLIGLMIAFDLPFFANEMAQWVYFSMDRWILGELTGNAEVGLYSMAFKLAMPLLLIIAAFCRSWGPRAMKAYQEDPEYPAFFVSCYQNWFYFLICCTTALSLFGPEILRLLTPEPYWESAKLLPTICIGIAFYGTTHAAIVFVSISQHTKKLLPIVGYSVVLNILLNFALIPLGGGLGASYALLFTFVFLACYYLYISQAVFPLHFNWVNLAIGCSVAFLCLAVGQLAASIEWQFWHVYPKLIFIFGLILLGFLLKNFSFSDRGNRELKHHSTFGF